MEHHRLDTEVVQTRYVQLALLLLLEKLDPRNVHHHLHASRPKLQWVQALRVVQESPEEVQQHTLLDRLPSVHVHHHELWDRQSVAEHWSHLTLPKVEP